MNPGDLGLLILSDVGNSALLEDASMQAVIWNVGPRLVFPAFLFNTNLAYSVRWS